MVRGVFRFRGRGRRDAEDGKVAILTRQQHELVTEEQALLERLAAILAEYPATPEDREEVAQASEHLTSLFLLVIVGEFNAGKSAFINALIGDEVMPEGVTPTTSVINLLRFGETTGETMLPDGIIERTFPADFLEDITVVDTPGTNAIIREHETLTERFVPRSDLVLFVTSADRPFTESEREFMAQIREWGKKIVIIINKIDLLRGDEQVAEVEAFVRQNIARLLGFAPEVFPVAALLAQQAKAIADRNPSERDRLWAASRFEHLERYVVETLDEEGRIRLKLLNPLGVGEHLADRYLDATNERLAVLREDMATIDNIERQLAVYQQDMQQQFQYHLTRIENIIARMNVRGIEFFDDTIRLGRIFDLLKSDKIRAQFEQVVVGDTEARIDETINELIDWMVEQDLRTWAAINEYIDRRRLSRYEDDMIGEMSSQFRYDRRALLEAVSKRAKEEVERYDPDEAAHELSQSVRNAVATVAIAEAGAVGLGALVVAAASTVAVDVTGILAASLLAGLGLVVLPMRKRKARAEFQARSEELERRLIEVMTEQFNHELARSVSRIEDAIAPYTRFVRTEQEKLTRLGEALTDLRNDLRAFRFRIGDDRSEGTQLNSGTPIMPLPAGAALSMPGSTSTATLDSSTPQPPDDEATVAPSRSDRAEDV